MEFVKSDGTLNLITCPLVQSQVMEQYGFKLNGRPQEKDGIAVYPKEFFAPYSYWKGFGRVTQNTHSIHYYMASWLDEEVKKNCCKWEGLIEKVNQRTL